MRQEIRLENAIGKSFEGFVSSECSSQAILLFEGNTFSVVETDDYSDSIIEEGSLNIFLFGKKKLIENSLLSEDEFNTLCKQRKMSFVQKCDELQRSKYSQLKQKYE